MGPYHSYWFNFTREARNSYSIRMSDCVCLYCNHAIMQAWKPVTCMVRRIKIWCTQSLPTFPRPFPDSCRLFTQPNLGPNSSSTSCFCFNPHIWKLEPKFQPGQKMSYLAAGNHRPYNHIGTIQAPYNCFYRTQVSLGSDLWVLMSVTHSLQEVLQT